MTHPLRFAAFAGLVAVPIVIFAIPATAHSQSSPHAEVVVGVASTKLPTSVIEGKGLSAHFEPDRLSAVYTSSTGSCNASDESLTLKNKSALDEDVIEGTSDFVNLPPGSTAAICLYGTVPATFVFELANADTTNTLTVAAS